MCHNDSNFKIVVIRNDLTFMILSCYRIWAQNNDFLLLDLHDKRHKCDGELLLRHRS